MFKDWVVSEETGYNVRFNPIDEKTAEYVKQLSINEGEKNLYKSYISLVSIVYILYFVFCILSFQERFKLLEALDKDKKAKLRRLNDFGKQLARTSEENAVKNSEGETAYFALAVLNQQFADATKAMEAANAPLLTPVQTQTQYSQPSGPFQFSPSKGVYYK